MAKLPSDAKIHVHRVGRLQGVIEAIRYLENLRLNLGEPSGRGRWQAGTGQIVVTGKPRRGDRGGCRSVVQGSSETQRARIVTANQPLAEQIVKHSPAGPD